MREAYVDVNNTFCEKTYPTVCVKCNLPNSADGYYFGRTPPWAKLRVGICKLHKKHGGSKIFWYNKTKGELS